MFEQDFWDLHSGINATHQDVAKARDSDRAALAHMVASVWTAEQVSERLNVPVSTVLLDTAEGKLYSYSGEGGRKFPECQFTAAGQSVIPSLDSVLTALPVDLHPQSVTGFFLTKEPDLILRGSPVSAKEWLEAGMPVDAIVQMAAGLKPESGPGKRAAADDASAPTHLRRSLTWDQGTEMGCHQDCTRQTLIPAYFCDPASPWQRSLPTEP